MCFNTLVYRSDELKKEYNALKIEKAELKRNIDRKQEKIKKLLADTKTLYQVSLVQFFLNKIFKKAFSSVLVSKLRACSYGWKLSRLQRKHFDKFTSEISPCYEII